MKRILSFLCIAALLSACTSVPSRTSIEQQLENPLTASRYGDELADAMANLFIQKDPVVDQPGMKALIEQGIAEGKQIAAVARKQQKEGTMGIFHEVKRSIFGYALFFEDTLYLSSDFFVSPGVDLHVYFSEAVDPRDAAFPDVTAVDLGRLQMVFGPQQYQVTSKDPSKLRTVVVWDTKLKQIYGFAQLSR